MAFDAGMLACTVREIRAESLGAKIEKIHQPQADQVILIFRGTGEGRRLLIDAGSNNPRLGFTYVARENPLTPPMFCMLLRKHLTGAKLADVRQLGFERAAEMVFDTYDEMGFACRRSLIVEIMGKYSNLVFTDENRKILAALKTVDFSTSSRRQILPGMTYEMPPGQEKTDPFSVDAASFADILAACPPDKSADKALLAQFAGFSAAVTREIVYRATGRTDTVLGDGDREALWREFDAVRTCIRTGDTDPVLISDADGKPVEYGFFPLTQYEGHAGMRHFATIGETLDAFFEARDREQKIRQRAADILRLLVTAEARLTRKLEAQTEELAACEQGDLYKRQGDLITANLYALKRGMTHVALTDYADARPDGTFGVCDITLDERLTPAQNAQRLYKKYNKCKTAKVELTRQIALGKEELTYLYTVFDALTRAETAADLAEIREELYHAGYASRMKGYSAPRKAAVPGYQTFETDGGFRVLCGKNNLQNEYVTHKLADKNDYWFHAKDVPGSHVILVCGGREPDVKDFTQAAEIAAFYAKTAGANIAVDYTLARNVKKPAGARPGYVTYATNWTAYVTPSAETIRRLRREK